MSCVGFYSHVAKETFQSDKQAIQKTGTATQKTALKEVQAQEIGKTRRQASENASAYTSTSAFERAQLNILSQLDQACVDSFS